MSNAMNLGLQPEALRVILTTGADFDAVIEIEGGTWDADEQLTIVLPSTNWAATMSGSTATWHVAVAVADTIPDGAAAKLKYTKTAGSLTQIWEIGTVVRRG